MQSAQSSSPASAEPFTIELYSTAIRFENDGTGERRLDVRIRIHTNEGAQQLKTLSFGYNAASGFFVLSYLRATKPGGAIVEAKPDALKDSQGAIAKDAPAFADIHDVQITTPPLAPGDTLDYEVVFKTLHPSAPGEFWYAHNFLSGARAAEEELRIEVPASRAVHIHWSAQFIPTVTTQGTEKIYQWKRTAAESNTASVSSEISTVRPKTPAPDVALSSFADWPAIGKWIASSVQTASAPPQEINDKAESLVSSAKTDLDKMEALYDFVSKQIRLTQISEDQTGFQIRAASKILSDGYGDALDKSALLVAMLRSAGLHADLALMTSGGTFDPDLPTPGVISREIVAVAFGNETVWLDPSEPTMPFRFLTPNLRGKQALVASAFAPPHFASTPTDLPFLSTQRVEINGRITSLGFLTARIRYTLRGDNEYALRMAVYTTPKEQWKQVAQTMATLDGLRGQVASADPGDPTATRDPFVLGFTLSNPDFLDWSLKQFALPIPLPTFGMPDAPTSSSKPVILGSPLDVTTKLTLALPVTDSARVPAGTAVVRDYAEYRSAYSADGNVLTVERSLRFLKREIPAARAADYAAFERAVENDEGQAIAVTNLIPDIPDDASPKDLMIAGAAALGARKYSNALRLFQRVGDMDPKQPGLWNDLGLAQLQLGQFAAAEASFRRQIAANPSDESANNLLGVALFSEKKYDDAASAFQKQISLKPLDANAHSSLGAVYIAQEKFQAAVLELEKAAVLNPDDAAMRVRLGQAYLGLKDTPSALKAFDKAAAISSSPAINNEIAFSLAEHNVALDRAERFARSALDATESQLRALKLEGMTAQQVQAMASLAPIWDTMGWLYFREGNIAEAQSFIEPAWHLEEDGSVAGHLGQIYEKRGDKTLAIHAYSLALATGGAPSGVRDRLQKLLSGSEGIVSRVNQAKSELLRMRTVPVGKSPGEGKATFIVLLESSSSGQVVKETRFLSGDSRLQPLGERLRSAKFPALFPVGSSAGIVLSGILSCSTGAGGCRFAFHSPSQLLAGR